MSEPIKGTVIHKTKDPEKVSRELKSTYGSTVILLTSNPEEIDHIWNLIEPEYDIVMDTDVIDNGDYAKVIVRKELNASDNNS